MIDRALTDYPGKGLISERKAFRQTPYQRNLFTGMDGPLLRLADHNPRRLTTKENPPRLRQGNSIDSPPAPYIQNPMSLSGLDRLEGFYGHAPEDKFCVERENRRQDIIVIPIQVPPLRQALSRFPILSNRRDFQVAGSLSAEEALSFWRPAED